MLEISETFKLFGAEVVIRPDSLSGDEATSESALIHVLDSLREKENYIPELVVFLQYIFPLTNTEDIDRYRGMEELIENSADSAVSVTDFHYFLWKNSDSLSLEGVNHDRSIRLRRQD